MARTDDSAAFAANWRTILAFDLALGLLVSAAGVVLIAAFSVAIGVVVLSAGAGYSALVGSRARRWRRLRLRRANGAS